MKFTFTGDPDHPDTDPDTATMNGTKVYSCKLGASIDVAEDDIAMFKGHSHFSEVTASKKVSKKK